MNEDPNDCRSKDEKRAYLRNMEAGLAEKQATLRFVKRKIRLAIESGRIHASDQLRKAEHQADCCVADLKRQLDQLEDADDQSWEKLRYELDIAWDNLSQSVRRVVARFP